MEPEQLLGPQNPGDGPLLRRVRLHQSWYRAAVLGLPRWGTTRGRSPRELGSVLSDQDAAAGLNFVSPAAVELYDTRHAAGWGVDPRCSAYMTSSQALTINLFGLLSQHEAWLLECLNTWLGRSDISHIEAVELEFAPARRSLHLNDQTRIDALLIVAGNCGTEVVAVEVKYADRFNSRHVNISTPPYYELARLTGLWTAPPQVLTDRRVNQLARIHALATSHGLLLDISAPASLLVLAHEMDTVASGVVDEYKGCVTGPLVHRASLRSVCASIAAAAPSRHKTIARDLQLRYGSESESAEFAEPALASGSAE
ncbi:PGN_0703 family putative restriction endonuclease [Mycolicibacterium senegalense]|uniref:PGN_0703 family putative restriction endonuclease n=1 Tax=Mycolicibacterium senegalense TaxID=1796 RepID=UPI003AAD4192